MTNQQFLIVVWLLAIAAFFIKVSSHEQCKHAEMSLPMRLFFAGTSSPLCKAADHVGSFF
jgi:hypothetical protein